MSVLSTLARWVLVGRSARGWDCVVEASIVCVSLEKELRSECVMF